MISRPQVEAYFADKESALIDAVSRLVRIDSTLGDAQPGKPFGPGPAAVLEEYLAMARELGLTGENLDGYVGVVDLNDKDTALHILGHLDIVPAGEGWTVTDAFTPKLVDGLLYGRGTSDDKGPMAAALLAVKAVKDLGAPLSHNVRLILGADEETGFRDIHWYYENHPYAPYTISPDADFPIINIEKGHYQPTFTAAWPRETAYPRVTSFSGGPRLNMVPPKAKAHVAGLTEATIRAAIDTLAFESEITFDLSPAGDGVDILCTGVGAHGSTPEEGHNAQTALVALLAALPLAPCYSTQAVRSLSALFPHGDFVGKALGIAQSDELSGHLSMAFTRLELTDTGLEGRFDSRTPLCATDENVRIPAEKALTRVGFSVEGQLDAPHHIPADSPFLKVLAKCYEEYTGQKSECLAIGGSTYVHDIPGGVAFGPNMPGFNSNIHGPDEKVNVKDLLTAAKIFTQVILDLCV